MRRTVIVPGILLILAASTGTGGAKKPSLWPNLKELKRHRIVDLTHAFAPGTPRFKGFPDMSTRDLFTYQRGGFWVQEFTLVGQYGTHVDPPAHFHQGLRTVDEIPPDEMFLPLVVVDCHTQAEADPDFVLTAEALRAWEKTHEKIPPGAFVAMRTDWSKRWPDSEKMQNKDRKGVAHYPGWTLKALRFLIEKRRVTAIGHEPTDTDPGVKTSKNIYECESYVLKTNHYQIELLANLDQVPETGAIVLVTFPKPKAGSGFPARVLAIVPQLERESDSR